MLGSDGDGRAEEIFTKMDRSHQQNNNNNNINNNNNNINNNNNNINNNNINRSQQQQYQ